MHIFNNHHIYCNCSPISNTSNFTKRLEQVYYWPSIDLEKQYIQCVHCLESKQVISLALYSIGYIEKIQEKI